MMQTMSKHGNRKILHVDDDPAILSMVARVLSKRGYSVVSVADPKSAIQALQETSARLVILDIDMPEKSGLSLLEEIKTLDGSIQVVMLTGMVSMATILRATQLGAEECLFKPIYDLNELGNAADRAYEKMLRWWKTLREWKSRNSSSPTDSQQIESISSVQQDQNEDVPSWPAIYDVFYYNTLENR